MEKKVLLRDLLLKHPADVAEVLSHLSDEDATELLHRLFLRHAAAEPLGEMEPEDSAELLSEIDRDEAINSPEWIPMMPSTCWTSSRTACRRNSSLA